MSVAQETLPIAVAMSQFSRFLGTDLGSEILRAEKQVLSHFLPSLAGYSLLQLSLQRGMSLCDDVPVGQYIKMGYAPDVLPEQSDDLWADYQLFPIANDCLDIVILHHVLEFSSDPHQLLREASRTLTDGGHMIVIGFNPLSSWPLYRRYWQWREGMPNCQKTVRSGRLAEWFSLLNYDVILRQSYFYRPPLNRKRIIERFAFLDRIGERFGLPAGMFYLLIARKRALPVNPIRQLWVPGMAQPNTAQAKVVVSLKEWKKNIPPGK